MSASPLLAHVLMSKCVGLCSSGTVLTVLHAGGKFGGENSGYTISGGLHGVGISVCNALAEYLRVTVWRDDKVHHQEYRRGKPTGPLQSEVIKLFSVSLYT